MNKAYSFVLLSEAAVTGNLQLLGMGSPFFSCISAYCTSQMSLSANLQLLSRPPTFKNSSPHTVKLILKY
jgi:hypothetical protein